MRRVGAAPPATALKSHIAGVRMIAAALQGEVVAGVIGLRRVMFTRQSGCPIL
ncbi:MAG: hypothetical protein C5S47_02780 [Candidatus Methanogasteraceae archaeon]|nr:MAG: hypothetical protein C5S47_02780 [ANME-2 cluster archaeon]